jgi:hypothetical protein
MPPPGSFTITFNLDQNLFALAMTALFGAMGLAVILTGLVSLRSTRVRPGFLAYARQRTPSPQGWTTIRCVRRW